MDAAELGLSDAEYAASLAAQERADAAAASPRLSAAPARVPFAFGSSVYAGGADGSGPHAFKAGPGARRPSATLDVDAAMAAELQRIEIATAAAATAAANAGAEARESAAAATTSYSMEDPVWGTFKPSGPPGTPFPPATMLGVMCCPCCIPPYTMRRRQCGAALRTWSVVLALLQVALLLLSLTFRGLAPAGINPMLGPWPDTLDLMQAKNSAQLVYGAQVWRLATPLFLHAGLIHLAANVLMQLRLGLFMELVWGAPRFVGLYFGAGTLSSLASAVFKPDSISVGSSGALMGVLGGWLVHVLSAWGEGGGEAQAARTQQLVIAVINIGVVLSFSFSPFIDWLAHVGGLLGGALLGLWFFWGTAKPAGGERAGAPPPPPPPPRDGVSGAAREWNGSPRAAGRTATAAAGIFSSSGAGMLLEPAARPPCVVECCPSPAAVRTWGAVPGAGLAVYLALVAALAAALWAPGQPLVRPPLELLDVCGLMQRTYPSAGLRCPF